MKNKIETKLYDIAIFILIFALIIGIIFTFDRLFIEKPINNCYSNYEKYNYNEDCDYNAQEIDECNEMNGSLLYNKDCSIECDSCYTEYSELEDNYNEKVNLMRMILSFIIALAITFIPIKDKIIRYALLSSSLIALFVATLMAMTYIGRLLPIVIIIEFLLVLFIYKKTK